MTPLRSTLAVTLMSIAVLAAYAQTPAGHSGHAPPDAATPGGDMVHGMAQMDRQMAAMRDMHKRLQHARTAEERDALMAEHSRLMQDGMAMMDRMAGMGHPGHTNRGGSAAAPAGQGEGAGHEAHREKRLQMMESMMQLMVDRIAPPAIKP